MTQGIQNDRNGKKMGIKDKSLFVEDICPEDKTRAEYKIRGVIVCLHSCKIPLASCHWWLVWISSTLSLCIVWDLMFQFKLTVNVLTVVNESGPQLHEHKTYIIYKITQWCHTSVPTHFQLIRGLLQFSNVFLKLNGICCHNFCLRPKLISCGLWSYV